mmetsp:Transcript_14207/g.20769  ORF Transcript_14207/g.20769 Transcript_14207/m.20769 type:complete len:276 (-) Transcript_14207:36-863(-)
MLSQNQQSMTSRLSEFWNKVPSFSRIVLFGSIGFYLFSWVSEFAVLFMNIPFYTVSKAELWRTFTGVLVPAGLVPLVLEMFLFVPVSAKTERCMGTVKYSLFFCCYTVLTGLVYSLLLYLVSLVPLEFFQELSVKAWQGIWTLAVLQITIQSNKHPDSQTQLYVCPIQIKSKYYPWLVGIVLGVALEVVWEMAIGIAVGYLHSLVPWPSLTDEKAQALESSVFCGCLQAVPVFIDTSQAGNEELPITFVPSEPRVLQRYQNLEEPQLEEDSSDSL